MSAGQTSHKDAMRRAREALSLISIEIEYDDYAMATEGEDTVMHGLSAMASALTRLCRLDLGPAAPLDLVLTEIGAEKELVDAVADFIELVDRSSYTGGLSREEAGEAEDLRQFLYDPLNELLRSLEPEQDHG